MAAGGAGFGLHNRRMQEETADASFHIRAAEPRDLAEIVRVHADGEIGRHLDDPFEIVAARHPPHQAQQPLDRPADWRGGTDRGRRAAGPRAGELALGMQPDLVDLLVHARGGVAAVLHLQPTRLAAENGERCLQSMRQRTRPARACPTTETAEVTPTTTSEVAIASLASSPAT